MSAPLSFQGQEGLWRGYRAEELATPGAFRRNPELVWEWYDRRRSLIGGCEPNATHRTLPEFVLITQKMMLLVTLRLPAARPRSRPLTPRDCRHSIRPLTPAPRRSPPMARWLD